MRPRVRDLPISTSLRLCFLIHTEKLVIHFLLTSISILHLLKSAAVKPLRRGRTEKSTNHVGGPVAKKSIDVIIRRRWKKKYERLNYITTRLTALGPTLELSAYWVARRKWHHKMQKSWLCMQTECRWTSITCGCVDSTEVVDFFLQHLIIGRRKLISVYAELAQSRWWFFTPRYRVALFFLSSR